MVEKIIVAKLVALTAIGISLALPGYAAQNNPADGSKFGLNLARPEAVDPASPSIEQVHSFVQEAVAYAKKHGKAHALKEFTDPEGKFHRGELYIYAYDFNGNVLAHGGNPNLVGKNLIGFKDPDGVLVISELARIARQGAGWLRFVWENPAQNNRKEPKLGYVVRVNDDWWLGSGTYGPAFIGLNNSELPK